MKKKYEKDGKVKNIKPGFRDYLFIVFTRFLPVTPKIRKKIRYRFLRQKEDIVLYESKSYIVLQVLLALGAAELIYAGLAVWTGLAFVSPTAFHWILAFLIEYLCFLAAMPLIAIPFYPFTGFWVRLEEKDPQKKRNS